MKIFVPRRALAIAKKEIFHIVRDPTTLMAALVLPIFMVVVFGLAIEFNVKNINMAVSDSDQTQSSRQLVEPFSASGYFIVDYASSSDAAIDQLNSETARAALIIPPKFQSDIYSGR